MKAERTIELYYDFSCPYAYLASTQIRQLAERAGAELVYKPFLLGGVLKALGAPDVTGIGPARARVNGLDMHRWADHWGVVLSMPPGHPNRTVLALRAALASEDLERASHALFSAYWAEGKDLSDPAVVSGALSCAGFDGEKLLIRAEHEDVKRELHARTDEAIARGVFGAPTCFVAGEKFWGQDRLDFVARALGVEPIEPAAFEPSAEPAPSFEFWYDFSSPFAYLASTQVEGLAARTGARIDWRPFLLGGLFRSLGIEGVPLFGYSEPKQEHVRRDIERFAEHYGVPFGFPSRFPMRTLLALRVVLAAADAAPRLTRAIFRAYWAEDRDISDPAVLGELGADAELLRRAEAPELKARLREATEEAAVKGLCGAPSFVVGDQLFFGQDRLLFVEKAIRGWRART
jgi:2-hydroxychromene-2-carboxylate isomerase